MHVIAVGVDTETVHGEPFTFQFYSKEIELEHIVWLRRGKEATRRFFQFLDSLPKTDDRHFVFFGHNLAFDMVSFFWDRHHQLRDEVIQAEWFGWRVHIVYAAVRFASFRKGKVHVTMIDTGAYFSSPPRKLAELAEIFCPNLPKLKMPVHLGKRRYTAEHKNFCAYAMRDSEIAYYVGLFLLDRHREWDVSISVSGPHFASKVFRRHFLKKTIPLPPRKVTYAALASYHGGKNGIIVQAGLYKRTCSLDIKSAYPYAMSLMPSFANPALYFAISGNGKTAKQLPPYGVYKISGTATTCKWPALYDHNFKPLHGEFSDIWTTGFELNEALRCREVRLNTVDGYFYDVDADRDYSPFSAYVNEFFERKEKAKDKPQREFNKLLMNALYGKFIQTRHLIAAMADIVYDIDEKKLIEDSSVLAGGLFNPFIATLITGHCRAYVHRLEHRYHAYHTATDGIHCPKSQLRGHPLPGKKGALGSVSIERDGDLLVLRNKLYIMYGRITAADRKEIAAAKRAGKEPAVKLSRIYAGKKIIKYALHGFHGTVHTLEELWRTGTRDYEYVKVNKLRESLRRNLKVNDFVSSRATLQLEQAS